MIILMMNLGDATYFYGVDPERNGARRMRTMRPFSFVLIEQDRADQPDDGVFGGEDAAGKLRRRDIAFDREGRLDDPDYISGLSERDKAAISRRNGFPFSMSVAAHEVPHLIGLGTGFVRIGGYGPQWSDCYPGDI